MLRSLLALSLFCLLLCAGLLVLGVGAWALGAVGASGLVYPLWGLGLLALIPLAFISAGRAVLRIGRGGTASQGTSSGG